MTCINNSLSPEQWKSIVSRSNQTAMQKSHKYPRYEGAFLTSCCNFQESKCSSSCFCQRVGCKGIWTLRPDLEFHTFLRSFANLWVRGSSAFKGEVNDSRSNARGRSASGIRLLREVKKRWCNWDGNGTSLPSVVSEIKHCYFCDDSFTRMRPVVHAIHEMVDDSTGVYTSKLVSQLFYDTAVPFDTASAATQRRCRYSPKSYGDGKMRAQVKDWILANKKSVDDFRGLDGAPTSCWFSQDRKAHEIVGTGCSRVLDKLFYA